MSVLKPIYLDADGILAQLADGSIINIGGVQGPIFTVGGRGLLFDDGTSTGGAGGITLQSTYDASFDVNGDAKIKLISGRDFVIADDTDDGLFFKIDSTTGKVTITGDFEVLGTSSIINTTVTDSDHWLISPSTGTTTALKIEPDLGVTPVADLVNIRNGYSQPPVFRIDAAGNVISTQNLTVGGNIIVDGLVDSVDVSQLKSDFDAHVSGPNGRHTATQVDITAIVDLPGATNVQQALEALDAKIESAGNVSGYEHIQAVSATNWIIPHNKGTTKVVSSIYDEDFQLMIPDTFKVLDANTVVVIFSSAVAGRVLLTLF